MSKILEGFSDSGFIKALLNIIGNKTDKVKDVSENTIAGFDSEGNLKSLGVTPDDIKSSYAHYETRYKNSVEKPEKPTSGSSGMEDGWSDIATDPEEDEYTWFSQCYLPDASTYQQWSDAVRLTGKNGKNGKNGIDGVDGLNGKDGKDGKDGLSVALTESWIRYAVTDNYEQPVYYPYTEIPTLREGQLLWVWTHTVYNNGTVNNSYSVSRLGIDGKDGLNGADGVRGADGTSSYFHVAYANKNSNGDIIDFSLTNPNGRSYIGTYVDTIKRDSSDVTLYRWMLAKGAQGETGEQGIPGINGINGKAQFLHIKYSNDAGNTFTDNSGETPGDYLGQYVDFVQEDSSDPSRYTWALIKGFKGDDGNDGTGINILGAYDTYEELQRVDTSTLNAGDSYMVGADLYVWTSTYWKNVGRIKGADGRDGTNGVNGKSAYLHIAWANSQDGEVDFTTSPVEGVLYTYIGIYTDDIMADSQEASSYVWNLIKGQDGRDGLNGRDGVDGAPGTDSYFHVAYANKSTTGTIIDFSVNDPTGKSYIGTYVDSTVEDSLNPNDYTWMLAKGADGEDGQDGIPGEDGQDGKTSYLHIKYSDDGETFTANQGEEPGNYLGQYVDFTQRDSTTFADYKWTLIKGTPGADGKDGVGINIKGSFDTVGELPMSGNKAGDAYIVGLDLYIWTGNAWKNCGQIKGEDGKNGINGTNGVNAYLHIAYATSADGSVDFSTTLFSGATYIGTYTDTTVEDSMIYTDYVWTKLIGDKGNKGDDAVVYKIEFENSIFSYNPNTNKNTVNIRGNIFRIKGEKQENYTPSTSDFIIDFWNANGQKVREVLSTDIQLSNGSFFTASGNNDDSRGEVTLRVLLILNDTIVASQTMQITKYGNNGERGKMGRFFYYAQEWADSDVSYNVSDAQAPYFGYTNPFTGVHTYWVFNPAENGDYTMAEMGAPSSSSDEWELMTNDFKYIITEAIFGKSARLAAFVMNGNLMISQEGLYNDADKSVDSDILYDLYSWVTPLSPQKQENKTTKAAALISSDFPDKQSYTLIDFTATQQYSDIVNFYPYEYDHSYMYFKAGVNYYLKFQCSTQVKCYLRFFNNSLTPLYPTPSGSNYDDILIADRDHADYFTPVETVFQVAQDGQYEIVFTSDSGTPNVRSVVLSQKFFSPNIVIDGKTGFIFQRKGENCYYQHGLFESAAVNQYLSLKMDTKIPIYNSNTGINKYIYVDENGYLKISASERPIGGF